MTPKTHPPPHPLDNNFAFEFQGLDILTTNENNMTRLGLIAKALRGQHYPQVSPLSPIELFP